jgi:hypothetical protein
MSGRRCRARAAPRLALLLVGVLVAASSVAATTPVEDIRDIRAPRVDRPDWLLPVLLGVAAFLALAGYGLWRRRRRRRALWPVSPRERAERRLAEIRSWMTPSGAARFAVEVSAVVREYIEQRFGVGATLLTSEEFMSRVLASPDPALVRQRARLVEFLRHCDLAKFAGERLDGDAMESLHAAAGLFVRETADSEEADDALPAT